MIRLSVIKKRLLVALLTCALVLNGCYLQDASEQIDDKEAGVAGMASASDTTTIEVPVYSGLGDASFLQYMQDDLTSQLELAFDTDDVIVENVSTVYVSKEYLEELSYNSRSNVYFGYTLDEITEQLGAAQYFFTVDKDGETVVQTARDLNENLSESMQNVAIGAGVVLTCVTIGLVTYGVVSGTIPGAPLASSAIQHINLLFMSSSKNAVFDAATSAAFSAIVEGAVVGARTGNVDEAAKAAFAAGAEDLAISAVSGIVFGEGNKFGEIAASRLIPSLWQSRSDAITKYGGETGVAYLNGEEVSFDISGSTRPDFVSYTGNTLIANEVKNYDLVYGFANLAAVLEDELVQQSENLPSGSIQRVILDVRGRGYSTEFLDSVVESLSERLSPIGSNISVELMA